MSTMREFPSAAVALAGWGAVVLSQACGFGGAEETTSTGLETVTDLVPTRDVAAAGLQGAPDATELFRNVDDGITFSSADDGASVIEGRAGVRAGAYTAGYDGAPAGAVTSATISVRAQLGSARKASVQTRLYDGETLVATGDRHSLRSGWRGFADHFGGLEVADGRALTTEVLLTNESRGARGAARLTQIWLSAGSTDCVPTTCASAGATCGSIPDGCGDTLDCGPCPQPPPPPATCDEIKAFPTAEGYGARTVGGRGGRVLEVTNLADSGAGSLREALTATGPRIVVFRVGGTIELQSVIYLREENSYVTVAGQTAPGDGIQIKDHYLDVRDGAHDVVLRHLRIRSGTEWSPVENEGADIVVWGNSGTHVYNVILDHCSFEWAADDTVNIWGWVTDMTVQWSLIAEGVRNDQYPTAYSKGLIVGGSDGGTRITLTVHHNVFANSGSRNPGAGLGMLDFRNNVVYNWSCNNGGSFGGNCPDSSIAVNFVGNHYLPGPDSNCPADFLYLGGSETGLFVQDNRGPYCPDGCGADEWAYHFSELAYPVCPGGYVSGVAAEAAYRAAQPFPTPPVDTDETADLTGVLLPRVGATHPSRDPVDARIVEDVRGGTGRVGQGSDYPQLAGGTPPSDRDHDGMPDAWEVAHALDPDDAGDGPTLSPSGYSWVEDYLNEAAGDPSCR